LEEAPASVGLLCSIVNPVARKPGDHFNPDWHLHHEKLNTIRDGAGTEEECSADGVVSKLSITEGGGGGSVNRDGVLKEIPPEKCTWRWNMGPEYCPELLVYACQLRAPLAHPFHFTKYS
jgi:hypothetical protein